MQKATQRMRKPTLDQKQRQNNDGHFAVFR